MFGNSVRSVSTPLRGYVCSSCLTRKNVQFPTRRQAIRFVSAGVVHSDSGNSASDPVLCNIGGQPKNANNEDSPAPAEETSGETAENEKEAQAAVRKETEDLGNTQDVVRKVQSKRHRNEWEVAMLKAARLSGATAAAQETAVKKKAAKQKAGRKTAGKKTAPDAPKKSEEADPSTFVKTLKSLRARKAAKPSASSKGDGKRPAKKREGARRSLEINSVDSKDVKIAALDTDAPKVPKLSHGLDRVLFNPGVYHLQDPRSRVYNFDPYLGSIMPISEFDFEALNDYITSSKDESLHNLASRAGKKYVGSSSSMTSVLSHFHYLLSHWREVNTSSVSQGFPSQLRSFTRFLRGPAAVFLRYNNGVYAVDADKEFDDATVLMNLGKSMEKLLTLPTEDFERYRRTNRNKVSEQDQNDPEAYHYSTIGDFVMRSQLDAYDPRLPGTGMFDLKTRAVVSVRMHTKDPEQGQGYQIKGRFGGFESYEREYYDMIRAAFLKYSLQVRIGRMDGIFVAFHNIERIFGFQYISLPEMDHAIHGQDNTLLGNREFKLSMSLWNKVLNRATERFPKQSLRFHFETREAQSPFMYIFAEPVTEEEIHEVQTRKADEIEAAQKRLLYPEQAEKEPAKAQEEPAAVNPDVESAVEFGVGSGKGFRTLEEALSGKKSRQKVSSTGKDTTVTESGTFNSDGTSTHNNKRSDPEDEIENENEQYDSESATDSDFLDALKNTDEANLKPLLGMILTSQNKVNGSPVIRPNKLHSTDKWEVDYEVTEFTSLSRAWAVYAACQKRRATLATSTDEEDDSKPDLYLDKLKQLSAQGRKWRNRQDEIDRDYGTIALDLESRKSSSAAQEAIASRRRSLSSSKPSKPHDSSSSSLTTKFFKFFS